jgi:hypothetical protein
MLSASSLDSFREKISLSCDDSTSVSPKTLDYSLGDPPKWSEHMVIPSTREVGIEYASKLQPLDFAFVLCNDGKWTYSIVCEILSNVESTSVDTANGQGHQPRIRFVLDRHGSTKTIRKKNWGHKIRLVNQCRSESSTP